ncbi:MAG TPA: hypothetical protein VIK53_08100 [Verrucomicrobiae bacterium]
MAELADAIRQHGVGTKVASGQTQQTGRRDERDADFSRAIKADNDGDALTTNRHEPMFGDLNPGLASQRQGKDFARRDVAGVIGLGKLRDCKPVIGQRDG